MSDVLSQNQIDELLHSLSSGDISVNELENISAEKRVRPYDFKIPKKFNKEQLKTLSIIYENYGRLLSSYLSGTLRSYCKVEVLTIEEQRYFEYSNALPENILMGMMEMNPLEGSSMITFSQSVAFAIIDRLLGGPGENYEADRDYTDIELQLLRQVVQTMCNLVGDAWSNVYEVKPAFTRLESNSRQSQPVSPNETVVIIMLNVEIRDVVGNISFCIPYVILEPVIEQLNTRYWFTESRGKDANEASNKENLLRKVRQIPVEMRAVLGSGHITLREALDLQVGDVIGLDQHMHQKAAVFAGKDKWFEGTLGTWHNNRAVRVDGILLESGVKDESK
ncbi:flagellar motor switch protein FliM [Ethanoligenens sp.]|uniref:flagellar motor switch protein FliM n=1 Tax=Ethanoligenens sp. TaxID=2099655 RepID=UPI0039EA1DFC